MSTLAEIEAAADSLPAAEQQELLLFLATRLHAANGSLPPLRDISREQMDRWIAEDEAGYRRFRAAISTACLFVNPPNFSNASATRED